jgi:hypothetical protein
MTPCLALRFSAVECANQKLVRNLNAERVKGEVLLERTSSLEKEVTTLAEVQEALASAEKEVEIAIEAKVSLTKVVEQGRNRAKAVFNAKHKAKEKAFEVELSIWQTKVQALTAQVAGLEEDARHARKVSLFHPQAQRQEEEASRKAKLILETTTTKKLEKALKKITKVEARYEKLYADYESLSENLQKVEEKEIEEAVWSIRDTKAKSKPMKDMFVGHCRTLLATGASARSVREQLFL